MLYSNLRWSLDKGYDPGLKTLIRIDETRLMMSGVYGLPVFRLRSVITTSDGDVGGRG